MRYMNLACLLMTLVCLTTILLFSGNQSGSGSTSGTVIKQQLSNRDRVGGHDEPISESIDSADSQPLVSPQLKAHQQVVAGGSPLSSDFDDFTLFDERRDSTKFRRKSSSESANSPDGGSGHEVEEPGTTGGGGSNNNGDHGLAPQNNNDNKGVQQSLDAMAPSGLFSSSLIDPILSQILNDMELGSLFKSIKQRNQSGNATNAGFGFLKPIIRRNKNGATIIISSSSPFNESSLNDSSLVFPSLLERLLPPGLRPQSLSRLSSSPNTANGTASLLPSGSIGTATITIGAEPIFASAGSSSSSSSTSSARIGQPPPPFTAMDPFGFSLGGHHLQDRFSPSSLFMEPMMSFRPFPSPFLSSQSSFGGLSPSTGLMSVLMRQVADSDNDAEPMPNPFAIGLPARGSHFLGAPLESLAAQHSDQILIKKGKPEPQQSKSSGTLNDTISSVQASQNSTNSQQQQQQQQQANKVVSVPIQPNLKPAESILAGTAIANESSGPLVSQKSKDQSHKLQSLYSSAWKKPQASSIFIFSSGAHNEPQTIRTDPFPFQLSPFSMGLPQMVPPQMMMLGGGPGEAQQISGNSPLNPILRSILNSVRSDLNEQRNRSEPRMSQRASGSAPSPHWSSISTPGAPATALETELDDEWNGNQSEADRWDEQTGGGKQIRARHRSTDAADEAADATTNTNMDVSDLLSNFQTFDQANNDNLSLKPERSSLESALASNGIVSGTIRQTIRGPGMTVERIIEVPSSRFQHGMQQVGVGVRSQSLSSRADPPSSSSSSSSSLSSNQLIDEMVGDYATPSRVGPSSPFGMNSLFSRSASNDRMSYSGNQFEDFPMPPIGFIGRLLSDMSKHVGSGREFHLSGINRSGSGGPMMKNHNHHHRFLNADEFDESDSNEGSRAQEDDREKSLPDVQQKGKSFLKATPSSKIAKKNRFTSRPHKKLYAAEDEFGSASPSQSEAVFLQPSHLIIPENFNADNQDKEINFMPPPHLFNGSGEPSKLQLAGSLDDTMNSMENRLNHVLSIGSHNPFNGVIPSKWLSNEEQQQQQVADDQVYTGNKSTDRMASQVTAPARPAANMIYLSEIGRMDPKQATSGLSNPHGFHPAHQQYQQHQQQQAQKPAIIQQVENPFTSPTSPLFGFPASSEASQQAAKDEKGKINPSFVAPPPAIATATNRKQRSFTYHSNNELASSVAHKQQQQQREQMGASDSITRPRFMAPFEAQPAGIVMGRRLDDRPNLSESMQIMDHPFGKPATSSDARNLINHSSSNFATGITSNQPATENNYRTIVV